MHSDNLRESMFSRVKNSPEFIPLLVYLHPPPTRSLTHSQADYWTQSLVDYYPERLKNEVLKALAIDPQRIVPLIPYILSKISGPNIVSKSQIEGIATTASADRGSTGVALPHVPLPSSPTVPPSMREVLFDDDPFVDNGPQSNPFCESLPTFGRRPGQVEDVPSPVLSPMEGCFWIPPRRGAGGNEFLQGSYYSTGHIEPRPNPIPNDVVLCCAPLHRIPPFLPAGPGLSSIGSDGGSSGVDPDDPVTVDSHSSHAENKVVHYGVVFWADRTAYNLSVPKSYIIHIYVAVYGLFVGFFSAWVFYVLSFSPGVVIIGGIPLSWMVFLVVGLRFLPEEYRNGW